MNIFKLAPLTLTVLCLFGLVGIQISPKPQDKQDKVERSAQSVLTPEEIKTGKELFSTLQQLGTESTESYRQMRSAISSPARHSFADQHCLAADRLAAIGESSQKWLVSMQEKYKCLECDFDPQTGKLAKLAKDLTKDRRQ